MFNTLLYIFLDMWNQLSESILFLIWFVPLVFVYELPLMLLSILGILGWYKKTHFSKQKESLYHPKVSCIITCYAEGYDIRSTIQTFVEQIYPGKMEIIAVVDGAFQNQLTYQVAKECQEEFKGIHNREVVILPKWQRGGRVSTLNAGLSFATGELVINADADTSFDNNMVSVVTKYFEDPNVPALGGALRVRNSKTSWLTRMQAIEYLISMQGGKTGLAHWNLLNNISGAFGVFRRELLIKVGGWDTHTAEDLDLTIRIKQYFARNPKWKLPFATLAIGHTDVPDDMKTLVQQRLRWDGDLLFLYFRKHWPAFTPRLLGWKTFIYTLLYGFMQSVLMPFVTTIYLINIYLTFPWQAMISVTVFVYFIYLLFVSGLYAIMLLAISERVKEDLTLIPWLPLYPVYSFFMRFVSMFALVNELFRRSHEESSMAPWWVLKRGRKF
ncbi:MAG: glycosyltransferase family 2 protein [Colwellia sp.]